VTHEATAFPALQAANHTCGEYDRGVDEFQVSGLTPVPSQRVKPPRVRESAVQLECRLNRVIDFKDRCATDRACCAAGVFWLRCTSGKLQQRRGPGVLGAAAAGRPAHHWQTMLRKAVCCCETGHTTHYHDLLCYCFAGPARTLLQL
jgi:hypothetical protein